MRDFNFENVHYVIDWRHTARHRYPCIRIEHREGRIPRDQKQIIVRFINSTPELMNQFCDKGWNNITINLHGVNLSPTTHELIRFLLKS